MNKVLLTGASGFIGSHIAELFSQENIPFKCLVRFPGNLTFLQNLKIELIEGDITNYETLQNALKEVDFVIHTAGKSSDWGKYNDFYCNNVKGTMNILKACKEFNIKDIIITGSISSYGEEDNRSVKNEESPDNSHYHYFLDSVFPSAMNHYRDTKALLTQKACEFAKENDLNLTVLEPAWVYGEREFNTGFYQYLKAVQQGMRWAPGSRTNKFHVIYAKDLAKAYLLAYQKKLTGINRLIVGNPEPICLNEIYTLFCQSAHFTPPRLIPKFFVYPFGFVMELIYSIFSIKNPPLLTRSRVNMMYDNIEFSVKKAEKLLGFKAKTLLKDGISQTVSWYKQNGYLPAEKE